MIPPEKLRSEPTVVQSRTIAVPASAQINRDFSVVKNIKQESSDGNAPLGSKLNLFKVLKNHQNGNKPDVFTTIGNRIVIPMKICVSAKKKFPSGGENVTEMPSTFRMAVPANKVSPSSKNTTTIYKVEPSTDSTSVTTFTTTTKTIVSKSKDENYGDLNKFMSTVTPNFPPKPREIPSPPKPAPDFDDELTSLSWLMSGNKELLDTIRRCNPDDPGISLSGDDMESDDEGGKGIFTATSKVDKQSYASRPTVLTEYNPLSKPPYSFSCLIFMAVENSAEKMLPVKDIYNWVCRNFPYFRTAPSGWKNSIRHNLSLNRCFKKADIKEGAKDTVKGSLWCIDPAYRPNLVQALKRSPFYPYLHPTGIGQPLSLNNLANLLPGVQTGRVPTWSPNFPPTGNLWADPDMASAALNLMELRQNEPPKRSDSITTTLQQLQEEIFKDAERSTRRERSVSCTSVGGEQVVITGSTQDHNYSCSTSPMTSSADDVERCASPESDKSAPDAAYEFETGSWSEGSGSDVEALFDSGFASLRSFTTNDHCDVITDKQKKKRKRKSGGKSSKKIKVKVNGNKKHKGSKIRGGSKNSDVDSGKDSPKVSRVQRRRKISQSPLKKKPRNSHQSPVKSKSRDSNLGQSPPLKKKSRDAVSQSRKRSFDRLEDRPKLKFRNSASPSNYNTRSSGQQALPGSGRLPGQQQHPPERRSKRRRANCDIDEEVQLAAGSLLRLAGLSSPLPPPRDKTT